MCSNQRYPAQPKTPVIKESHAVLVPRGHKRNRKKKIKKWRFTAITSEMARAKLFARTTRKEIDQGVK
jgi:hypothetical protein